LLREAREKIRRREYADKASKQETAVCGLDIDKMK
jgi:hypothetical protein